MKENENDIAFLRFVFILFIAVSVLMGIFSTIDQRTYKNKSGCEYKSYATKWNLFYSASCELFRDRTIIR